MNNPLINGKDITSRITCIEIQDEYAELFFEDKPSQIIPNKYWILSDKPIISKFTRLKGNLHYKYGIQFSKREDFNKYKAIWRKQNKDIFSIYDPKESSMVNRGWTYYKNMKLSDVSILSFDIETTGLTLDENSKVLLISNTFRKNGKTERKLFCYDEHENIFEAWSSYIREINPSIIICHNGYNFDLPYSSHCASKIGSRLSIGKDNSDLYISNYESKFRKDGSQDLIYHKPKIYGREIIDTYLLAMKYDVQRKYTSYGLKNIIKEEGLEQKNRVFYDAAKIRDNYKNPVEWQKIKDYCQYDADDALALFDLMAPSYFYFTQCIPKSFQSIIESSTGGPLNSLLIRSYLQNGHSLPKATEIIDKVEGGISFGVPKIYRNLIKVDLKSAYPSQILRFKLYNPEKDPEGNFYKMVKYFTEERFELKDKYKETNDKYYSDREQAGKVVINSAYGLCNTKGLNFNCQKLAAKITSETREMIKMGLMWASGKDLDYWLKEFEEKTK